MTRFAYATAVVLFLATVFALQGCEQDNEEDLLTTEVCDTTNATYSAKIRSIFSSNCTVCHSGASPSGGLDFATSANIRAYELAVPGRILQVVRHEVPGLTMPRNASKLSGCTIRQLELWFANGLPE
jgi:mono/diheme cytochrome c family protein